VLVRAETKSAVEEMARDADTIVMSVNITNTRTVILTQGKFREQ
jgi:hypothetical protein